MTVRTLSIADSASRRPTIGARIAMPFSPFRTQRFMVRHV